MAQRDHLATARGKFVDDKVLINLSPLTATSRSMDIIANYIANESTLGDVLRAIRSRYEVRTVH